MSGRRQTAIVSTDGHVHRGRRQPGSPAARGIIGRLFTDFGAAPGDLSGDGVLDLFPDSLQSDAAAVQAGRIPVRPVPWSQPGEAVPGVAPQRPPARCRPHPGLDLRCAGHVSGPPSVHLERFVDRAAVLPSVDLVVHHGGSGTMLGAAAHDRPQLVLPLGADEYYNGETVTAAGVGLMLEAAEVRAGEAETTAVADTVDRLLAEPSFRTAAAAVRKEIAAMPHPQEVLPDLLHVARRAARGISRGPSDPRRPSRPAGTPGSRRRRSRPRRCP